VGILETNDAKKKQKKKFKREEEASILFLKQWKLELPKQIKSHFKGFHIPLALEFILAEEEKSNQQKSKEKSKQQKSKEEKSEEEKYEAEKSEENTFSGVRVIQLMIKIINFLLDAYSERNPLPDENKRFKNEDIYAGSDNPFHEDIGDTERDNFLEVIGTKFDELKKLLLQE